MESTTNMNNATGTNKHATNTTKQTQRTDTRNKTNQHTTNENKPPERKQHTKDTKTTKRTTKNPKHENKNTHTCSHKQTTVPAYGMIPATHIEENNTKQQNQQQSGYDVHASVSTECWC